MFSMAPQVAKSTYILKVTNNVQANAKLDYPDVEKKVFDKNDSDAGEGRWGKSADHDIGDAVPFELKGDIPNFTGYKHYYYAFHDTMDTTLNFNADSVKVTVGGIEIDLNTDYTLSSGDHNFDLVIEDLMAVIEKVKGQDGYNADLGVVVTYTATLADDAVIGNPGQENNVKLEFSNDPTFEGEGKPDKTGETPEKTVVVFTYDVNVNKVDGENKPLAGADFTLQKFVYDDSYPEDPDANNQKGYWKDIDKVTVEDENPTSFGFKGLDDGKYRLKATKTPDGYNTANDIYFTVTATHNEERTTLSVTGDSFTITGKGNGTLTTDVVNNTGNELPETGGIGTTIFYIVGGLLVLFAGVLLITKRRMKDKN